MAIRANVVLGLWVGVLAGCGAGASTPFEGAAADAAVADATLGEGQAGYDATWTQGANAPATTAAAHAPAASRADDTLPSAELPTAALIDELRDLEDVRAPNAIVIAEREAAQQRDVQGDASGDRALEAAAQNRYPGVALASTIAGIRARVGSVGEDAIEHGSLRVLHEHYSVLALARANEETLGASSRAWQKRPVRVVTSANEQCRGHVAALELASPWAWKDELFEGDAKPSSNELREMMSGMLGDVVAHVVLDEPCRGTPILVEDPSRSRARIARTLPRVPREREVLDAFRKLPRYRALRAECEQLGQCEQEDPAVPAGRPIDLRAFQFPHDRSVYVVASMAEGSCGDWGPPMSAIFELDAGHAPKLYRANEDAELGTPTLLLDVEGDGHLELVTTRFAADLELVDETGASQQSWSTTFVGCTC